MNAAPGYHSYLAPCTCVLARRCPPRPSAKSGYRVEEQVACYPVSLFADTRKRVGNTHTFSPLAQFRFRRALRRDA